MDFGKCCEITVTGLVQGVGFRPFVSQIAAKYGITGFVKNHSGIVKIVAEYNENSQLQNFSENIKNHPPKGAVIENFSLKGIPRKNFDNFYIENSTPEYSQIIGTIQTDIGICSDCQSELIATKNPFQSCNFCGPRYSFMEKLPYDRENTTLKNFPLCSECQQNYSDFSGNKGYAQGLCCTNELTVKYLNYTNSEAIAKCAEDLSAGKIVSVKGIGGFHIVCRADLPESIAKIRALKVRETKPFAVMFPNLNSIKEYCKISQKEEKLLIGNERPIVILQLLKGKNFPENAGCKGDRVGAFLPSTGLEILLFEKISMPLIFTSANISNSPIIYDDKEILQLNIPILGHNRKILHPVEDSVVSVFDEKTQIIRRSKGYVPLPIPLKTNSKILAMGGDLKAYVCFADKENAVLTPYIGDLAVYENFCLYKKTIDKFCKLLNFTPDVIVCDLHPMYFSGKYAQELSEKYNVPLVKIQHHKAHAASVAAEKNLEKFIAISLDGVGYGEDNSVWGGEFFHFNGADFEHFGAFDKVKLIGGDISSENAKLTAECYFHKFGLLEENFVTKALDLNANSYEYSGVGRLFDAVASTLNICHYNSYEGECATELEYYGNKNIVFAENFPNFEISGADFLTIKYEKIFKYLLKIKNLTEKIKEEIAYSFHYSLAKVLYEMCLNSSEKFNCNDIVVSGGCFQNKLLLKILDNFFSQSKMTLYFNEKVPCNDGGICLGQAYLLKEK